MFIKRIILNNFRNYESLDIELKNGINIIYGDNAQGKTNLLESLYVLGLTKSHRSFIDNNLIKKNSKSSLISGFVIKNEISTNYEIEISSNKILKIDGDIIRKNSDYISNINIIIFYPDDLELIKGAPNIRRRYINLELSQLYSNYLIIINEYNKLLKMRNEFLKKIKTNYDKNYLEIVTNYLIEKAIIIYKMRKKYIDKLNENNSIIFKNITGFENFILKYKTSYNFKNYETEYLRDKLKEIFDESLEIDIKNKTTNIGPHRDDLEFLIDKTNLRTYGSQGQQRIAVIALKLSEIEIFKQYKNENPILLLDDVFSELDDIKKNNLLKYISNDIQTIITTTDLNNIDQSIIKQANILKIESGKIT